MNRKDRLKEAYIQGIEKKLEKAKASYEVAKSDTIEAEGRMITRYDSSKTETAWLADGRLKEVKELEQCIHNLKANTVYANMFDTVYADLIINKEFKGTDKFVLAKKGEEIISDKYLEAFLGRGVGDVVVIEENRQYFEYQIREIKRAESKDVTSIESLVTLVDKYGTREVYYIVNYIGGIEIVLEDEYIFCLSRQTYLAKALLGKKRGEQVVVSEKTGEEMLIEELII